MANSTYRHLVTDTIDGVTSPKNYIRNAYARENINGWALYANTPQATPVNGTGGSPTITLVRNTSSPLANEADFQLAKSASNSQGQGVSYDFTIDSAYKNQKLAVLFNYSASTNFAAGSSSDIQVFMYDITNSALVALDRNSLLAGTGEYVATFTATTSTSYRLIFHIATVNALAYTIDYTNVIVGPTNAIVGTNVNVANSSILSMASILANGTRVTGTPPTSLGQYRSYIRAGNSFTYLETGGAPATLPSVANGIKIDCGNTWGLGDSSNFPSRYDIFVGVNKFVQPQIYLSTGRTSSAGFYTDVYIDAVNHVTSGLPISYDPTTGIVMIYAFANTAGTSVMFMAQDVTSATYHTLYFDLFVADNAFQIQLLSSGNSLRYFSSTSTITSSLSTITYATKGWDTDNAYSGGVFTCINPGRYRVDASLLVTGTLALNNNLDLQVQQTGSLTQVSEDKVFAGGAITDISASVSDTFFLQAGDTLKVQASCNGTTPTIVASNTQNFFSVTRLGN